MKHTHARPDTHRLLLTRELAQRLGVEPETVRRWARDGLIPVCRIGMKTLRFDLEQVIEAIACDRPEPEVRRG